MPRDRDRERIGERWATVFRIARTGFRDRGRGVVLVRDWEREPEFVKVGEVPGGAGDARLARAVGEYDPGEEAVVVVLGSGEEADGVLAVYELRGRAR